MNSAKVAPSTDPATQAKVAPSSNPANPGTVAPAAGPGSSDKKPPVQKQNSSKNMFSPSIQGDASNTLPKQDIESNARPAYQGGFSNPKTTTLWFVLVLGLVFIIGGSVLTWYGTFSEVKDLLVLGPGCLIIGFAFVVAGVVFAARTLHSKRKSEKNKPRTFGVGDDKNATLLENEYIPSGHHTGDHLPESCPPSGDQLYGEDNVHRARRASSLVHQMSSKSLLKVNNDANQDTKSDNPNPNTVHFYVDNPSDLAVPAVAFPTSIVDTEETGPQPTYKIIMDTPKTKPDSATTKKLETIEDEAEEEMEDKDDVFKDDKQSVKQNGVNSTHYEKASSETKAQNNMVPVQNTSKDKSRTRHDSGIEAETPNSLDTDMTQISD